MLSLTLEMAPRKATKGRQEHPTGPLDTVDNVWKDDLRVEMKRLGWDQKDLAGKIPCSRATITNMFKSGDRQIRHKARIEELVGWTANAEAQRILANAIKAARNLSVVDAKSIASIIDSLAKKP